MEAIIEAKILDLSNLDVVASASKGAVLEVLHPTLYTKLGIKITLVGADSDRFKNYRRDIQNKRLQETSAMALNLDELEDQNLTLLATCTIGWDTMPVDGVDLPFTIDNAKKVYKRFPWLKEQVDNFIGTRANFIRG
jgi:hypothetical protein